MLEWMLGIPGSGRGPEVLIRIELDGASRLNELG